MTEPTVLYDFLSIEVGKEEVAEYSLAVCEVIQLITQVLGEEPGFFSFSELDAGDPAIYCDDHIAFKYSTGSLDARINGGYNLELTIPGRLTAGLISDDSTEQAWKIQHVHRSLDLIGVLAELSDLTGYTGTRKFERHGDRADFEEKISKLNEGDMNSMKTYFGKYFK